jgi:hypothetical protein
MRVSFLPLLVVALSALSPIAAQDPNGDAGTGVDTSTDVPSDVPSDTPTDTSSDTGAAPTDGADTGNNGTANDGTSTDGGDSSDAGVAPSEPSPEFVVKIGGDINSMWVLNENTDQQWTNMTIELMTGSNFNMVHLSYVGQGINAVNSTVHNFRAPMVHPTGQIYFLQL